MIVFFMLHEGFVELRALGLFHLALRGLLVGLLLVRELDALLLRELLQLLIVLGVVVDQFLSEISYLGTAGVALRQLPHLDLSFVGVGDLLQKLLVAVAQLRRSSP